MGLSRSLYPLILPGLLGGGNRHQCITSVGREGGHRSSPEVMQPATSKGGLSPVCASPDCMPSACHRPQGQGWGPLCRGG